MGKTDSILMGESALNLKPKKYLNENGFPKDFSPLILFIAAVNMSS